MTRLIDVDALDWGQVENEYGRRNPNVVACEILIENAPTIDIESKWVPCSERLPNKDGQYLVQTNWMYHGTENMDVYDWAEGWNCYRRLDGTINRTDELSGKDFVAWQPLPTSYKGE